MTKIPERPSRAGARIMQALADNNGLAIVWNSTTNRGADWTGTNYPAVKRALGKPKVASLRKLKAQGHITTFDGAEDSIFWTLSEIGWEALGKLPEGYLVPELQHMSAAEIVQILRRRYSPENGWELMTELHIGGYRSRRIDALAFRIFESEIALSPYLHRIAFEIKIDRADWKHELEDPTKRIPAMELAHEFYFIAPAGVIPQNDMPEGCGLMEVTAENRIVTAIDAGHMTGGSPDWALVAAMLRSIEKPR